MSLTIKDIIKDSRGNVLDIFNNDYYTNIYKKTEKITYAVFLITDKYIHNKDRAQRDIVLETRNEAQTALRCVIDTLTVFKKGAPHEEIRAAIRSLLILRSLLTLLVADQVIANDLREVLTLEIDLVIQNIHGLSAEEGSEVGVFESAPLFVSRSRIRKQEGSGPSRVSEEKTHTVSVPDHTSRKETILSIIRTKGIVSIKDISDSIKDYSEKTIQRELNTMIKDNLIKKEGERRWSKYSVI